MTDPITTPEQALEAALAWCKEEADKCEDAAKWGGARRYVSDCKAAAYALRNAAAVIQTLSARIVSAVNPADARRDAILALIKERHDPSTICADCDAKYGRHPVGVATWYPGCCDICGKATWVTQPRDFGGLKEGWGR